MNKLVVSIALAIIASSSFRSSVAHADKVFRVGKGATWDCKQDPVVSIEHGNGTYTLKGSCTSIALNGGNNTLTIESIETLNITGANNNVTADAVGAINIIGSHNTVTYRSALHGDAPSVSKVGTYNVVNSGGKPADGGGKTDSKPAAERRAGASGAQDCSKTPTAAIDTGEGSYKFVGPCTRIVVNGGENTLAIESVQEIVINGSDNTATIGSADKISVLGADNKVSYRKGISGAKPKVGSLGERNTITQIK